MSELEFRDDDYNWMASPRRHDDDFDPLEDNEDDLDEDEDDDEDFDEDELDEEDLDEEDLDEDEEDFDEDDLDEEDLDEDDDFDEDDLDEDVELLSLDIWAKTLRSNTLPAAFPWLSSAWPPMNAIKIKAANGRTARNGTLLLPGSAWRKSLENTPKKAPESG